LRPETAEPRNPLDHRSPIALVMHRRVILKIIGGLLLGAGLLAIPFSFLYIVLAAVVPPFALNNPALGFLCLIFSPLAIIPAGLTCLVAADGIKPPRGRCPKCGYDITRSPTGGCPECGWNQPE
jgi:hypothetical protein